jgi:hypothetical protein
VSDHAADGAAPTPLEPVIGLEIHVQLATATKMFCGCELSFGEPPNTRTCAVCLGLPGSLPVANERAVHFGLMIGLALGSELAARSIFHRKNYFYPDLPKGYQISQYDEPLCRGGRLGDVRIHRIHLEEDAAKLIHVGASGRIHGSDASVVDFNRGGTPLAEIVTEPDLRSPEQCNEWLKLLRATLLALGVSDVNMEEGSLRCDANISLRAAGRGELGTKTELKNMNSFRFLERGVRAEIERQREILQRGGEIVQETLHYDPAGDRLTPLRSKEEVHDYRYFPEPDLIPVAVDEQMRSRARAALPELPAARAERFERELGLSRESAQLLAFRADLGERTPSPSRPRRRSRTGSAGSSCAVWGRARTRPVRSSHPPRSPPSSGSSRPSVSASARQGRCSTSSWPQVAATRRRSSSARGSPRWTAARSSRRSWPRRWRPTPTRPSACAPGTRRRSARSSARSCARRAAAPTVARCAASYASSSASDPTIGLAARANFGPAANALCARPGEHTRMLSSRMTPGAPSSRRFLLLPEEAPDRGGRRPRIRRWQLASVGARGGRKGVEAATAHAARDPGLPAGV